MRRTQTSGRSCPGGDKSKMQPDGLPRLLAFAHPMIALLTVAFLFHVASLGLAFSEGDLLPQSYRSGAFIGEHGSWNRIPFSGYKVVFVPFAGGRPSGLPIDVLTGFLSERGEAQGRPSGVAIDRKGALLVADDVGNVVWRVGPASASH